MAALGPANLRLTGELADGWIGNSFFPATADAFFGPIGEGASGVGRRSTRSIESSPCRWSSPTTTRPLSKPPGVVTPTVTPSPSGPWARRARISTTTPSPARGYGDDVEVVQRLWASGDRTGAAARVPIAIGLGTNLVGPPATIKERLAAYERSGVTTLRINLDGPFERKIADLETLLALVADTGDENSHQPIPARGATP